MAEPTGTPPLGSKIAFIFDERLSHDRKKIFARTIARLRTKFKIDLLPQEITEAELITRLEDNSYSLVLLPWYKYLSWKKLESFYGSMRMTGPTVAGYFADAILPFEIPELPNYNRVLLFDFYRFEIPEIQMLIQGVISSEERSGFAGLATDSSTLYRFDWFHNPKTTSQCIDVALQNALFQNNDWSHRTTNIRFALTALWLLSKDALRSQLEMCEINQRLMIKLVFEDHQLTLHHMMDYIWPHGDHQNTALNELYKNVDFLRIHHFPESHQIEMTAYFTPMAPSIHYPNEVRGIWVEPLKLRHLENNKKTFLKTVDLVESKAESTAKTMSTALAALGQTLISLRQDQSKMSVEKKSTFEAQLVNARMLVDEIDKKLSDKTEQKKSDRKKAA